MFRVCWNPESRPASIKSTVAQISALCSWIPATHLLCNLSEFQNSPSYYFLCSWNLQALVVQHVIPNWVISHDLLTTYRMCLYKKIGLIDLDWQSSCVKQSKNHVSARCAMSIMHASSHLMWASHSWKIAKECMTQWEELHTMSKFWPCTYLSFQSSSFAVPVVFQLPKSDCKTAVTMRAAP